MFLRGAHASADAVDATRFNAAAFFMTTGVRAVVPDVIDPQKERDRLGRELKKLEKELGALEKKLENPAYTERAPADVVAKSRADVVALRDQTEQMRAALAKLG